jgi:hypothetical protein
LKCGSTQSIWESCSCALPPGSGYYPTAHPIPKISEPEFGIRKKVVFFVELDGKATELNKNLRFPDWHQVISIA